MMSTLLPLSVGIAMGLMKQGAMMTVLSTLLTALAWPATLIAATDFIDSKWSIAIDRFGFCLWIIIGCLEQYFCFIKTGERIFLLCYLQHVCHLEISSANLLEVKCCIL